MRILVFGNSGSGKSTYALGLARRHGIAHLDLDTIAWEPGLVAVRRAPDAVRASLAGFIAANATWVIEGCYGDIIEAAAPHATGLVFLNPGRDACLANNLRRPWEPHKYASPGEQNRHLDFLQQWVAAYYTRDDDCSYRAHRRIFDAHPGEKTEHTAPPPPNGIDGLD